MRIFLLLAFPFISSGVFAARVFGIVTDAGDQPLSFSTILVKGTAQGTSANSSGSYSLLLAAGEYTLVCQHIGYRSIEKKITVTNNDVQLHFTLPGQRYDLGNVIIKNGEDPAYGIIRNAIKKRSFYEKELKKFETEVYIKGQFKLRDFPNRFFGQKVDFEDGDTSKRKMIFLSETVARYSVDATKSKVEVMSTKVSGNKDGFGFSNPQILSFYANNLNFGSLNPRGFVSPISNNALNFYNYKFEGTFFENGQMINRIKVTPKRKYEPLFNGYINIIENDWRIHSLRLTLYKENQMQLADTLVIEQLYVPLGNVWVIKQQTIYPSVKMLGFDAYGSFVQVYDKFNLEPVFAKDFFDNTVLKVYDSANKKTPAYWDTIRPIPLQVEEIKDYKKKDSLEIARQDPAYLDSLDKIRNKPNVMALITSGQTYVNDRKRTSITVDALLDIIQFNTVEGAVLNFSPRFTKRLEEKGRRSISITPNLRYGFSSKRFNAHASGTYSFGKKYFSSITLAGGRRIFQIDNANPILPRTNTIATLMWEKNLIKLYEASFARVAFTKGIGDGFTIGGSFQYQDRTGLQNTTLHKWRDVKDRVFTPNIFIPNHQASVATININWQPGARYVELPERKYSIGSKYPTLNLLFTKGIKGLAGSDVDFLKWRFGVSDNLNLKLAGRFSYRLAAGGFINRKSVFLPDFQHYFGNQQSAAAPYLNSFQLMKFYSFSNKEKFYSTAHVEYHLNGLLTNKIPLFKKFNWFLVTGNNTLYLGNNTTYTEVFVGLENIFKVLRLDYVQSFTSNGGGTSGIRFSLPGILRGENE